MTFHFFLTPMDLPDVTDFQLVVRREIGANKSDTSGKPFRSPLVWTLNSYNAYAPAGNLLRKKIHQFSFFGHLASEPS
jgi:hypothetical protein